MIGHQSKFLNPLVASAFSVALLAISSASAATITNFSDWQINSSNLSSGNSAVNYITEDQHADFLDPGYGGQDYDAEAIYTTWDSNYLYIGVMTGREQNPGDGWAPGDIAIDIGSNGSYEFGMVTSSATGDNPATAGIGLAADLYAVSSWNNGIWDSAGNYVGANSPLVDTSHPTSVASGSLIGTATSFSYDSIGSGYGNWANDEHYFISAVIDLNLLGGANLMDDGFSIHWTANCNNDWLQLDIPASAVPVPAPLMLLMAGLLGLIASGRARKNTA
ncbi:MAG: hypothetical protein L3J94_05250 [Gammaproteobacteria bacterium]|nr:hypothetical protein [Gammaproteobacteria bacterium]